LEHLGDEIHAKLKLSGKRAFEKRSVNPPVVAHRFEAYFGEKRCWHF
jgi:hypothetical protein